MSLREVAGQRLTSELLNTTILSLSSISRGVDVATLVNNAITAVADQLNYLPNNDIGICVNRIINGTIGSENIDGAAEDHYLAYRPNDGLITDIIRQNALRIASVLSSTMQILRDAIPNTAAKLEAEVNSKLPTADKPNTFTVDEFNWGKLSSPGVQTAAIDTAQTLTNTLRNGKSSPYDVSDIIRSLPLRDRDLVNTDINVATKLYEIVAGTEDTDINYSVRDAIDIITGLRRYSIWVSVNSINLTGDTISKGIVETVRGIDDLEERIERINNLSLEEVLQDYPDAASIVRDNIVLVKDTINLFRAAMLYYKEFIFKHVIIMDENTINTDVLPEFESVGGTRDDLIAYMSYLRTEECILGVPRYGVQYTTVIESKELVNRTLVRIAETANSNQEMVESIALQNAITTVLEDYYTNELSDKVSHQVHELCVRRTITNLNSTKAIFDAITEYLITINQRGELVQVLYNHIRAEYIELAKTTSEADVVAVNTATVKAMIDVVLSFLITNFCESDEEE